MLKVRSIAAFLGMALGMLTSGVGLSVTKAERTDARFEFQNSSTQPKVNLAPTPNWASATPTCTISSDKDCAAPQKHHKARKQATLATPAH